MKNKDYPLERITRTVEVADLLAQDVAVDAEEVGGADLVAAAEYRRRSDPPYAMFCDTVGLPRAANTATRSQAGFANSSGEVFRSWLGDRVMAC